MARKDSVAENIQHFKDVFSMFDVNKDGQISIKELDNVAKALSMNVNQKQLEAMIKAADKDGNSSLDFNEFVTVLRAAPPKVLSDALLLSAFKQYDANGDGFVTAKELRDAMKKVGVDLSDEEVSSMISTADADGDHRVNYQEFLKMMKN